MTTDRAAVHAPVSRVLLYALAAIGITLVVVDVATGRPEDFSTDFVDRAVVMVTLGAPILLGVAVLEFVPAVRGGAWAGLGVLLIGLGVLTLISGIGLAFILSGLFLLVLAGNVRAEAVDPRAWLTAFAIVVLAGIVAAVGAWFTSPSGTVTVVGEVLVSGAWVGAIVGLRALDRRRRDR